MEFGNTREITSRLVGPAGGNVCLTAVEVHGRECGVEFDGPSCVRDHLRIVADRAVGGAAST